MTENKNIQKYESYKAMHENLSKAMKNGFFYEAIFIEYAILEDRFSSVLRHAGIPYMNNKGRDVAITEKIKRIRNSKELSGKFYKDRLTEKLLDELVGWLGERNDLIHHLAKLPYDSESVKHIAETGYELVMTVQKKSASVIRHLNRVNNPALKCQA